LVASIRSSQRTQPQALTDAQRLLAERILRSALDDVDAIAAKCINVLGTEQEQ
jgi:hypothetical protein